MKKIILIALSIMFLSGCELIAGRLVGEFNVRLEPEELSIVAGGKEEVTLIIEPITGVALTAETAEITLKKAPEGVSINPEEFSLPTGINDETFEVIVDSNAPLDNEAILELRVIRGDIGKDVELQLIITGQE